MPISECRLCGKISELQLSHVIPAFVYRWLRESSGNGFIRASNAPNKRVQDGPQEYWLCADCEARFGRSETTFANQLFHPYLRDSSIRVPYGPWLLHFCVSVTWRVLQTRFQSIEDEDLEPWQVDAVRSAEQAWRDFLLGHTPNPGRFRHHLVPLERFDRPIKDMPPNFNRYLTRAVQIDLCHSGETMFMLAKMGRFLVLGFISQPNPDEWSGSKINANDGRIEPRTYKFPGTFLKYLFEQSRSAHAVSQSVSDKQRAKIDKSMMENIDRLAGSDFFDALNADVEMFGSDAFGKQG